MPFKSLFLVITVIFCCALACSPESPPSPEEVARKWQKYVDNNQFDAARKLSTPRAQEMVSLMERIFRGEDEEDMMNSHTRFKSMVCVEKEDTLAICSYQIIDEEELIRDSFTLIKQTGHWLVDIPEEDELMDDGDVEKLFNEFEDILNKALEEEAAEEETAAKQ